MTLNITSIPTQQLQVAQLSQRDRVAEWVSLPDFRLLLIPVLQPVHVDDVAKVNLL